MDVMSLLPARYSLDNLRFALRHPQALSAELHALGNRVNLAVHRRRYAGVGNDVLDEDWDNLFILDACRYDVFADQADLPGTLERRISKGSESWRFLRENFAGRDCHDVVYVTANPHAYKLEAGTFHATWNLLDDRWDPELQTVRPEVVADAAREALEQFPDKRLIVHFMQPHFPFLGETGQQLDHGGITYQFGEDVDADVEPADGHEQPATPGQNGDEERIRSILIWGQLRWNLLDVETVWQAYCENLDIVLPVVEELLSDLDGRTVVTSDHGNLFGERLSPIPTRAYGHPPGLFAEELRRVPWHIVDGPRRSTTAEPPVERETLDEEVAQERLRDLGYVG